MFRQIPAVCLKCLFSLVVLLSLELPVLGQSSSSAAVSGIVQDTTDARIANARVKLINSDTGTESDSKTNGDGSFLIPSVTLPQGRERWPLPRRAGCFFGGDLKGEPKPRVCRAAHQPYRR
jgi:Carboxypeptidase regulatory-like domain